MNATAAEIPTVNTDSLVELNPFFHKNRANRPKKSGKTKGKKACKYHKFDEL